MAWEIPMESKSKVDWAGKILIVSESSESNKKTAITTLNNWRASHSYPIHIFKKRIKEYAEKLDKNCTYAGRLKREVSIIRKLKRFPKMKLSRMQDIAGCRVIFSNSKLCETFYEEYYENGNMKHKMVDFRNYITKPKKDGYRGIHVIYKYVSQKKGKEPFNGLSIEIQIRSRLQHIWATTVEIVDFFTEENLKFGQGSNKWKEFFKLVSCVFALMEYRPRVPGLTESKEALSVKIKKLEEELGVIEKLKHWAASIEHMDFMKKKLEEHYFLLEIDTQIQRLTITSFPKNKYKEVLNKLRDREERFKDRREFDVVLVDADNIEDLKETYPNYFVDVNDFIKKLNYILINNT